jgi:perosamine synthetase
MTPNNYTIPVYRPDLSGNEKKYVNQCLEDGWISSKGSFVQQFEEAFASKIGAEHATSVSNGTVALHLALLALGIGQDDEIIVPTLTYIASVNCIKFCNAIPVFADSIQGTWQIDPIEIRKKITPRTRAILVVHLYGQSADMDEVMKIAEENGLSIIEDCAEAFGTLFRGRHVGSFGDIATFSFFGNKTITTGEGGMVTTKDKALISQVCKLKNQGLSGTKEYWHDTLGYNYRMTNIQAAIGLAQLERSDYFLGRKREIAKLYEQELRHLPLDIHGESPGTRHSYWMINVLLNEQDDRDPLRQYLSTRGIETRPLFYPAHTMPMYREPLGLYPVAENLSARGITLPSWPGLSDGQIRQTCQEIAKYHLDPTVKS